jgi:hypothetical protein
MWRAAVSVGVDCPAMAQWAGMSGRQGVLSGQRSVAFMHWIGCEANEVRFGTVG